ncbi:MAG: TRIC cation channel family protein [Firmicutes bacterium]|nr:TRIC cation channel family protein [Bacillota bacterium]
MEKYLLAIEIIGTVAFAMSGVLMGIKKDLDLFGVVMLGLIAATGGGLIRDMMLGQVPPVMFQKPVYAVTAVVVGVLMLIPRVYRFTVRHQRDYELVMLVSDSAGLGLFTAAGLAAAINAGYGYNQFMVIFTGVWTGVGGGLLRDVISQSLPYIFTKHFYASACIIGAVAGALLWNQLGEQGATYLCAVLVFVVRLLAARFRWKMPRASKVLGTITELQEEELQEREQAQD